MPCMIGFRDIFVKHSTSTTLTVRLQTQTKCIHSSRLTGQWYMASTKNKAHPPTQDGWGTIDRFDPWTHQASTHLLVPILRLDVVGECLDVLLGRGVMAVVCTLLVKTLTPNTSIHQGAESKHTVFVVVSMGVWSDIVHLVDVAAFEAAANGTVKRQLHPQSKPACPMWYYSLL